MDATPKRAWIRRVPRFLGRCCALAAAVALALSVVPWPSAPRVLPAVSPYVMLGSSLAARSVGVLALFALPVLVLALLRRRWFCRYACPVGLATECVGWLSPSGKSAFRPLPPVGQWVALITLAGAAVGYPLLLWLDPLVLFGSYVALWQDPLGPAALVAALGLPLVLILSLLLPNAWCLRICPLGATQDLLAEAKRLVRRSRRPTPEPSARTARPLARRTVLAAGLGGVWAAAALGETRRSRWRPIRPPGAVDEEQFTGLCVRCGNCIRACPTGIIKPDSGELGTAGYLTPVLSFERAYCLVDCRRCTEVCPTGAIAPLSLAEKKTAVLGLAKVDMSICVLAEVDQCGVCADRCPYEAIQIVHEGYTSSPQVDRRRCTGCGACQVACITAPQKAIRVVVC